MEKYILFLKRLNSKFFKDFYPNYKEVNKVKKNIIFIILNQFSQRDLR